MFGIDTLVFLFGPFVVPFLVGLKVKSKKLGLIPLLVIPALSLASGIAMFRSSGTYGHTDATPEDFAAVTLIVMGGYLAFVFTTCWLLGRWVRNRERPNSQPAKPIDAPEPPQTAELIDEGGALRSTAVDRDYDGPRTPSPFEGPVVYASSSAMDGDSAQHVRHIERL